MKRDSQTHSGTALQILSEASLLALISWARPPPQNSRTRLLQFRGFSLPLHVFERVSPHCCNWTYHSSLSENGSLLIELHSGGQTFDVFCETYYLQGSKEKVTQWKTHQLQYSRGLWRVWQERQENLQDCEGGCWSQLLPRKYNWRILINKHGKK